MPHLAEQVLRAALVPQQVPLAALLVAALPADLPPEAEQAVLLPTAAQRVEVQVAPMPEQVVMPRQVVDLPQVVLLRAALLQAEVLTEPLVPCDQWLLWFPAKNEELPLIQFRYATTLSEQLKETGVLLVVQLLELVLPGST